MKVDAKSSVLGTVTVVYMRQVKSIQFQNFVLSLNSKEKTTVEHISIHSCMHSIIIIDHDQVNALHDHVCMDISLPSHI